MKKSYIILFLSFFLFACNNDDEPDTAPITTELVELNIPVSTANYFDGGGINVFEVRQEINLAEVGFANAVASATEYRINFVGLTISGVPGGTDAPEVIVAEIGIGEQNSPGIPPNLIREDKRIDTDTPFLTFVTDGNGNLTNISSVPVFNRLQGEASIVDSSNNGINLILQQFIANENLTARIRMGIDGEPISFNLTMSFNLSVR